MLWVIWFKVEVHTMTSIPTYFERQQQLMTPNFNIDISDLKIPNEEKLVVQWTPEWRSPAEGSDHYASHYNYSPQ
jgi:hypothetical protein